LKHSKNSLYKKTIQRIAFTACVALCAGLFMLTGCKTPAEYRTKADDVASEILHEKTILILGEDRYFTIDRPSDILRRRLLTEQELPTSSQASFGSDRLDKIDHWPEENYPRQSAVDPNELAEIDRQLKLGLMESLEIGARNSFQYQTEKEDVFREALALDLQRNEFRNIFATQIENNISGNTTGSRAESGYRSSGEMDLSRKFTSGVALTSAIAVDLANLLTGNSASSLGIKGDTTISIPLLRGSGKHIVAEPLTQAERNVVYAIYEFERFKRTFAVDVATGYFEVLRQLDAVKNSTENYRSLISSTRRSRRRADAGRLQEFEVDQALQNELRARDRWIRSKETYKRRLDAFKILLGLPTDATIELKRSDLDELLEPTHKLKEEMLAEQSQPSQEQSQPADAPIVLVEPSMENAGPMEIPEFEAVRLAFDNRLDLRVTNGKVYDAQRAVIVAADALGAELTFFGAASSGARRTITSADLDDAQFRTDKAKYSALLTLDLPIERTTERNKYRNSFINLERAVREVQKQEDKIKLSLRNELRDMLQARESLYIQARSVLVAEKRVKSVNLFIEAGRAQVRDLLEAQESLLSAQNSLTSAVVEYRIAELQLQRDIGLLKIDEKGLWQEFKIE
jgi:outer membrane protein TolC